MMRSRPSAAAGCSRCRSTWGWRLDDCPSCRLSASADTGFFGQSSGLTAGVRCGETLGHDRAVAPTPRIPAELRNRPFSLEEARRHGLTKHHLDGESWRRIATGFYARRDIASSPMVVLTQAELLLVGTARH